MKPAFDSTFAQLYDRAGMAKLDRAFAAQLKAADIELFNRFMVARAGQAAPEEKQHSELLIELAPHVEDFLATLFGKEADLQKWHNELAPLYACRRIFVQRRAAKALRPEEAERISPDAIVQMLPLVPVGDAHFELVFAKVVMGWLEKEKEHTSLLELAARYASWALQARAGQARHAAGVLFAPAQPLGLVELVPLHMKCYS